MIFVTVLLYWILNTNGQIKGLNVYVESAMDRNPGSLHDHITQNCPLPTISQVNGGHNIHIGTSMPTSFGTRSISSLLHTLTLFEFSGHYRHETNLGLCVITRSILTK
jgi:hypothetical protein